MRQLFMTLLIRLVDLWHCWRRESTRVIGRGSRTEKLSPLQRPNDAQQVLKAAHSSRTCRHTQLMNKLQLQLQLPSNLPCKPSLSRSLCLVLVAVTVGCSPLPLPLRSRTKAAAMHFLPNARIRIPYNVVLRSATDSLPQSLTAWLTGWRSGGLLRNAKQHTMQPRGKHNTQSDFYIKTASASPAWLRWWCCPGRRRFVAIMKTSKAR